MSIVPYILLMHVSNEKLKWEVFETVTYSFLLLFNSLKRNISSTLDVPKVTASQRYWEHMKSITDFLSSMTKKKRSRRLRTSWLRAR